MSHILYLHGFASGPSSSKALYFQRFLEEAGTTVEILDLAAGDFEHLTLSGQLQVIEKAAAARPVTLIGSSMGGYLAALYAARHPEVDRLVLLAPAFAFAHRWQEYVAPDRLAEWRRTGHMEVFHYAEGRNREIGYQLLEDAKQFEDFPDFRQPALIFHGRGDDVVPATYSEDFAKTRPNVRLELVDAGHDLLNVFEFMREQTLSCLGLHPR